MIATLNRLNNLHTMGSFLKDFFGENLNNFFDNNLSTFQNNLNIIENENNYVFSFILPSFDKDEINIEIIDNVLKVSSTVENNESKNYLIKSFIKSSFEKNITLSDDMNTDNIEAEMKNGILNITFEKKSNLNNKKITIK